MKLVAMALLTLLLCGVAVQAGEPGAGVTGKGIRIGGGFRSVSSNSAEFEEGTTGGFMAGAFVTYNLSPKVAIQPELLYAVKGAATSNLLYDEGLRSHYLELPVLVKYTFTNERRLQPSLFFGPAVSILLAANLFSDGLFSDGENYDVKDGMKSTDVGLVLGGDMEFRTNKSVNIVLDVRYTLGLVNIVDPTAWNAGRRITDEYDIGIFHFTEHNRPLLEADAEAKNRMFSFMIGIKFL